MKKLIFLLTILLAGLLIVSCDSNDTVTPSEPGSIYITSNPSGAQIWLDGDSTSFTTPDTVTNVDEGVHEVTIKLRDYNDTTFSISVTAGEMSVVGPIALILNINTTLYGPVTIYEITGTNASQPSGLDLSSGIPYGVSSAQNGLVDIYYYSDSQGNTYLIQSADLYPGLIRQTKFHVGSSTDLLDKVDSPLRNAGTWTDNMSDREDNYVFLYDHDGHYSKLIISDFGGGNPGDPAWVEVYWFYNNTPLDNRF
jgi:PEGA domain